MLSAKGITVTVKIEEARYLLHNKRLLVNGTFITEVHVAALVIITPGCFVMSLKSSWLVLAFTKTLFTMRLPEPECTNTAECVDRRRLRRGHDDEV